MLLYYNGMSACFTHDFFCYFVFLIDIGFTNKNHYHITQFEYYSLLKIMPC